MLAVQVSDNDGSAFITKAEFDSLKNNFQAQLDRYFSSIDNKIDDAIAQYLAGVKVESVSYPDNFVKKINFSTTGGFMPLAKKWTKPNTNKPVNGLLALMAAFTLKNSSGNATWNGMATVGVSLQSGSGVVRDTVNWQDRPSTRTNAKYFMLDIDNGRNYVNNEVKEIECLGHDFDPTYHQAVMTEHIDGKKENEIIEVLQKGYTYKDKVIRPAMVKVSE